MMTPDTRSIPPQLSETNQRKSWEIQKYRIIYQEFYENITKRLLIIHYTSSGFEFTSFQYEADINNYK